MIQEERRLQRLGRRRETLLPGRVHEPPRRVRVDGRRHREDVVDTGDGLGEEDGPEARPVPGPAGRSPRHESLFLVGVVEREFAADAVSRGRINRLVAGVDLEGEIEGLPAAGQSDETVGLKLFRANLEREFVLAEDAVDRDAVRMGGSDDGDERLGQPHRVCESGRCDFREETPRRQFRLRTLQQRKPVGREFVVVLQSPAGGRRGPGPHESLPREHAQAFAQPPVVEERAALEADARLQ